MSDIDQACQACGVGMPQSNVTKSAQRTLGPEGSAPVLRRRPRRSNRTLPEVEEQNLPMTKRDATYTYVCPALLLPPTSILWCGAMLWRFRFARRYPSHRRAWWLVPIVKITMDLGAELGRWKALCSRKP